MRLVSAHIEVTLVCGSELRSNKVLQLRSGCGLGSDCESAADEEEEEVAAAAIEAPLYARPQAEPVLEESEGEAQP